MQEYNDKEIYIRGFVLKKIDEYSYHFKNDEFDISAYKFIPGKDKFPDIENIDSCTVCNINDSFYAVFAKDNIKKQKFCL